MSQRHLKVFGACVMHIFVVIDIGIEDYFWSYLVLGGMG